MRLAKTYVCVHCRARFKRCAQGKMVIDCPAERVKAPQDTRALRRAGYTVIDMWSHNDVKRSVSLPQPFTRSYPHAILYDFDAYGDKNQRKEPTPMLTFEITHVPISVSTRDTLEREPTHIFEKDPASSVMEELERRGREIREKGERSSCQKTSTCFQSSASQDRRMVRPGSSVRIQLLVIRS